MGIESANHHLRNTRLKKGISKGQIPNAFRLSREYNLRTNTYLIIGIPGETEDTINESMNMIHEIRPDLIRMTFLQPYKGTEIYDYCKKNDLFNGNETMDCFTESPLKLDIDKTELLKYKVMFPWYVNLRNPTIKSLYSWAIEQFKKMDYSQFLKSFDKVLKIDSDLSEQLEKRKIPHYKYFKDNTYYFQLKCRQ